MKSQEIDRLLHQTSEWLKGRGPYSQIVISTRIRLARNLKDYPFPQRANTQQRESVMKKVLGAKGRIKFLKDTIFLSISELSLIDRQFLVERHLMSLEHSQEREARGLLVSCDEVFSLMINEEDHLRIQVLKSGFNFQDTWQLLNGLDDELSSSLDFAFLREWGYLTACPTNVGTGLRGSVMLHLPGLVLLKRINKILSIVGKLNFAVRGLFGEGTQAIGNFFQISNQVSLGLSEEEIIEKIEGLVKQIIEQEEESRRLLLARQRYFIEDKIWRAYGLLKNVRIISSQETLDLLSMLRLGVDLGIIKNINHTLVNELFIISQPAHLQKFEGKILSSQDRDIKRANLIRGRLNKNV